MDKFHIHIIHETNERLCSWPDLKEQPRDDTILRHAQIELRKAEIEAVVDAIQKLSSGEELTRYSMCSSAFDWSRFQKVDASKPIIVGHSLGGSAAVSIFQGLEAK